MRAYGELIANVAKTVDQFMRDNIGEARRPRLARRALSRRARGRASADRRSLRRRRGRRPPTPTARRDRRGPGRPPRRDQPRPQPQPAGHRHRGRQCRTAAGHRGAAADGQVAPAAAGVDGDARHQPHRRHRRHDQRQGGVRHARRPTTPSATTRPRCTTASSRRYKQAIEASYGGWFSPIDASALERIFEQEHVATVGSALDETSESKAEVKAKLSGEVRVNFKSDYLPMDKMATPEMMSVIQGNARPTIPTSPPRGAEP